MAFYVSKSMLSKFNKVKYPSATVNYYEFECNNDHWQNLIARQNNIDLAKEMLCRVCGKNGCTPLNNKIDFGFDILNAICSITNVTMDPDDSLPKYICDECLESLRVAWNFKKLCETSDRKFKNILNPLGNPLFHTYPYSKHDFQMILRQMKARRNKLEEIKAKEIMKKEKSKKQKDPKSKQFKCSPCDMDFPNKEALLSHRRERQCMRRACDICGQLVLSIAQHMRYIHKQDMSHKCDTCGKQFYTEGKLKSHMMIHTNTFNFFCDLCPYKCKQKYYLVAHMRIHTGEKPYKCTECSATFVNPSNLNKHKLTHQEKQFKCGMCEKAFRTTTALREHNQAAHMNIKHSCSYCGRDFCYKSDLRKHEIRNHNRMKREIGGEPIYKQLERMQKIELENNEVMKWRPEETLPQQPQTLQVTYMDQTKDFGQASHVVYYSDVVGYMQQQQIGQQMGPQMVQQPTVQNVQNVPTMQLTLPDLKKDEVKIYDAQQTIGYF